MMKRTQTDAAANVTTAQSGPIATVTMDLGSRVSVLSVELLEKLEVALRTASANETVRAIVLRGKGRSFSAGGDLAQYYADFPRARETAERMVGHFHACIRAIRDAPTPVIAVLQGPIAGGGFSLALACDFGVAAEDASFVSAYTKLGTNPDGGGTWSLTRMIGFRRAMEVVLLNEPISAQRALELGLVTQVVPAGELDQAVNRLAHRLAKESVGAVASVKRLIRLAADSTLEQQLDREKEGFVEKAGTTDFREGVSAFFERREARFS